jgi:putative hemolysin
MPDGATTGSWGLDLLLVLILIGIGGFFAASEIALLTVKRHRLDQLAERGSRSADVARRLTEDPNRFLATIQVAITFLGFLASAVGAVALSGSVARLIEQIPWTWLQQSADTIAFLLVTLLIALASIVVGELVPKTLALNYPERLSLIVSRPLKLLERVLAPLVWVVSRMSLVLVRLLGGRERPQAGFLSVEELKMLVATGSQQGQIEEVEKEMIHGVIELGDTSVHEVMIPRIGIRAVEVSEPLAEILAFVIRAGHSRVPVYEESLDNIVGILYAKDLLPYLDPASPGRADTIDVRALARPAFYVPESKRVDELLADMRANRRHLAIVVDEYGGTAGLVTFEDIVEEIVGDIQDEYDTEESLVEPIETDAGGVAYRLNGRVTVDDLRDLFGLGDTPEADEEEYDTVGGLVIHRSGRIPLPGAEIEFRGVTLRVAVADSRRVSSVIAERIPPPEPADETDEEPTG